MFVGHYTVWFSRSRWLFGGGIGNLSFVITALFGPIPPPQWLLVSLMPIVYLPYPIPRLGSNLPLDFLRYTHL